MDPHSQVSFIPKKPLVDQHSVGNLRAPHQKASLFGIISLFILIAAVALSAAVYLYNSHLNTTVSEIQSDISTTEQKYSASVGSVTDYARTDLRLRTAEGILNNHVALSPIFALLGQNTAQNVQFTDFNFGLTGTGTPTITLSGIAKSFNSVSVQSQAFSQSQLIQSPVFSGVSLDDKGNVLFQVTADISPSVISYDNSLSSAQDSGSLPSASPTATSTSASASTPNQ